MRYALYVGKTRQYIRTFIDFHSAVSHAERYPNGTEYEIIDRDEAIVMFASVALKRLTFIR